MSRSDRKFSDEDRRRIVELAIEGASHRQIAAEVGWSKSMVTVVLRPFGGVFRSRSESSEQTRALSLHERIEIRRGLDAGLSINEIGRRLSRPASTISRELERNDGPEAYRPAQAQDRAVEQRQRPKPTVFELRPELGELVCQLLEELWSPEQIAGSLKLTYPDDPEMWVSHETIYKTIYVQGRGELRRELARCLRSGRAQRKPRGRMSRPGALGEVVEIRDRPVEVEDRGVPGHWEGDLIIGAFNRSAIGTLVERTSRFLMLLHLPDGYGAEQVRDAITTTLPSLPEALHRSLTWDRGAEMAHHAQFTIDTGIPVYFCDPHKPWQRGTNENTNGLLRQYLPKGTDLSVHSAADLDRIADSLNSRPRKTLGFMTPSQKLAEIVALTA